MIDKSNLAANVSKPTGRNFVNLCGGPLVQKCLKQAIDYLHSRVNSTLTCFIIFNYTTNNTIVNKYIKKEEGTIFV